MSNLVSRIERQPRWLLMACLCISLSMWILGYIAGVSSLVVLDFIYIFFASWFIGMQASLIVSVSCSVELFVANLEVTPAGISFASTRSWNSLVEGILLVIAGYLFSKLRVELEQKRAAGLESTNRE